MTSQMIAQHREADSLRAMSTPESVRLCTSEEDFAAWDRFLFDFPGAQYFQTYGWLQSYKPMGLTPHLMVYERDSVVAGGVAFLSIKIPFLSARIFIVPHGPIPSDPEAPSWLPLMRSLDNFFEENAIYAQIYPHELSNEYVVLPRLEEIGFAKQALFTAHHFSSSPVLVDLREKTEDDVLKSLRKQTRYYVRRALSSSLELRTDVDSDGFDKIYDLFLEHGRLIGFQPRPAASFQTAWQWFAPKGLATFIQAWHGDTLVGANLVVFTGRTAYYVHGAVRRGFADLYPAEFIHWHGIRKALELHLDNYDLVNMGGPPGVDQFKRGFRPQCHSWHHPRTKVYRPVSAKLLRTADQYFRPLIRTIGRRRAG